MGKLRIESKKDLRLVGRAIREGWDYDRKAVIQALMDCVKSGDPELMLEATDRLLRGDEIELKRELVELKKAGDDNAIRLRLIELARNLGPDEVAKLASKAGLDNRAAIGVAE